MLLDRRLTAWRVAPIALGVLVLHLLLIGRVSDRLAQRVAPDAVHRPEPAPPGVAPSIRVRIAGGATSGQRDHAREPAGARPSARHLARLSAPPDARRAAPAAERPARAEPLPGAMQAARALPIEPPPAAAAATTEPSAATEVPTYPTRLPGAFAAIYTLTRGTAAGEAELRWQPDGERYVASLRAGDGADALIDLHSEGRFDGAGIAPQRFVDRRRGRGALAANFRRDAGTVTFSGPRVEHRLAPGMQDRLSWMIQLAAILAADPAGAGDQAIEMIVVGARGEADVWRFEPLGRETLALAGGEVQALRFLRRPQRAYDTRAEVWISPSHDHLALRVRLSNGGERLQLEWRGAAPAP